MATLVKFLKLLDRDDVTEIALQNERPAFAKVAGKYTPVSQQVLGMTDLEALFVGTPLQETLPPGDGRKEQQVALDGYRYMITIARTGPKLQIRIIRQDEPTAPASDTDETQEPAPVQVDLPTAAALAAPASAAQSQDALEPNLALAKGVLLPAMSASVDREAIRPASKPILPVAPAQQPVERPRTSRIVAGLPTIDASGAPDPYLVETILSARQRHASDVHLIAGRPTCFRLFGKLQPQGDAIPKDRVERILLGLLNSSQRDRFDDVGYADFSVDITAAGRVRANVSRQATGLKGCFRLVPAIIPTLSSLGLPSDLNKVTRYHQGLAIISGPSGHGKTTTMAALVDMINTERAQHIITIEDPVEVIHPPKKALISQREVGVHTRSFATALRGALRQDPDVIVIGELRDVDTVEIALSAAETGHLVLATMNTRTAATTIDRLISMFPPDKQEQVRATLAGALMIVVSQRLLPNVNGDGLVAAAELITGSVPLWNMIRDNNLLQLPNLQARGRSAGMIQFDVSLKELVDEGKITEETALLNAENAKQLAEVFKAAREPEIPVDGPAAGVGRGKKPGLGGLFKRGS